MTSVQAATLRSLVYRCPLLFQYIHPSYFLCNCLANLVTDRSLATGSGLPQWLIIENTLFGGKYI